jgi:hypothetical protein
LRFLCKAPSNLAQTDIPGYKQSHGLSLEYSAPIMAGSKFMLTSLQEQLAKSAELLSLALQNTRSR